MQVILEIIGEALLLFILRYPGALIRWLLTGCKRPFREVLDDDSFPNELIGVIAVVGCIAVTTCMLTSAGKASC
jgi:hypothetical protein